MTDTAIRQATARIDIILADEFGCGRFLILCRLPRHIVNLIARTEVSFRVAMTIETPFHVERLGLPNQRHLIDTPVTGGAPDTLAHVNAVIEIGVIGQIMHPIPFQRRVGGETGANWR